MKIAIVNALNEETKKWASIEEYDEIYEMIEKLNKTIDDPIRNLLKLEDD